MDRRRRSGKIRLPCLRWKRPDALNDWSGGLLINSAGSGACSVTLGANNQLASNNVILVSSNGTAQLTIGSFTDTVGSLSSAVSARFQITGFSGGALTVGANNASGDFAGQINGILNLTKIGTGTQILSGTSSDSGPTTVNGGKLVLDGSFTSPSATIITKPGTTLAGTGSFLGTITVGGTISPVGDNRIGILTTGGLILSNATLTLDLGNLWSDRIIIPYNLITFGTNLIQTVPVTTNLSSGQQITVLTYSGTFNGGATNFAFLPPPAGYSFSLVDPAATPGSIKISVDTVPPKPQPVITNCSLMGTNLTVTGTNSIFGGTYYVLTSTNVTLPLANWTVKSSNLWTGGTNFTFIVTNAVTPGSPRQFYILQVR